MHLAEVLSGVGVFPGGATEIDGCLVR